MNPQSDTPPVPPVVRPLGNAVQPPHEAGSEYEFSESESHVVRQMASAMRFVGAAAGILALLVALVGVRQLVLEPTPQAAGPILQGCLLTMVGLRLRRAARKFNRIVTTERNDVTHLMAALSELGRMFRFQRAAILVAIGVLVLTLLAGAAMGLLHPAQGVPGLP